jgi:iron complex outermembrane receptor protein
MIHPPEAPIASQLPKTLVSAAMGGLLLAAQAALAQDTNAPVELKPTVVTGTLLPSAETVGVAPVESVSAADIEKVAAQDVLATLKALSPGFSGNGNIGQSLNNGGFGEAYIALRNLPTLVLIDGQRLNITPFSTFVGTYAADMNVIPLAMIDHIEVLKDGASTIYGSDAIGGVVNIITKKDFNGAEINEHYGFATGQGVYNEEKVSVVGGYSKDGTRIVAGAQYYYSDPLLTADRTVGSMGPEALAAANLHAPSYFSPSYPGHVQDGTGNYLLAGSPLAVGAPGYIKGLNTPPVIGGQYTTISAYNAAAAADGFTVNGVTYHQDPYIPISSIPASQELGASLLNTTSLKTYSIQSQDRRTGFANFEHDIFDDHMTVYGQVLASHNESQGQLAPAPIPALEDYNITVPYNNPYNPFGIGLGAGTNSDPRIRARLIETGDRSFDTTSDFLHSVAGLKGDVVEKKLHYDLSVDYSQTTEQQVQNSASSILLNQAMTPGAGGLSQLGTPVYNIFGLPGVNSPSAINAIKASDSQGGFSDLLTLQGIVRGDLFDLPAGPFRLAAGGQYVHEQLDTTAGALLSSGNLVGLLALPPYSGGTRERVAGFAQSVIPVVGPDHHIPGLYSLEIDAEGRFETISSEGITHDSLVPKVGFRWQPLDEQVTVRGTYSQGFVVPPLTQLYGPPLQSSPYVVTTPGSPAVQQTVNYLSNPNLPPANAETFTLGAVYSPKQIKGLTLSVDYYHIEETDVAFYPSPSRIAQDLNAHGTSSVFYNNPALHGNPIYVDANGNPYGPSTGPITDANFNYMNIPLIPGGAIRTEGLDFGANYKLVTQNAGTVNLFANANLLFTWQARLDASSPWLNYKGQYTDVNVVSAAQGLIPDYNINTGFTWSFCNFDYTVIAHYIPSVTDLGDMHPSVGSSVNDFTVNGKAFQVSDYYKLDMQLAYNFRKGGHKWYENARVAIGCNNITDVQPPLIASSSEDNTDKSTYDILGRFVYMEFSKKF